MNNKIKSITISKLFGYLDHEIYLNNEKITIIHGPNGVGKTVILRMINGLFNLNLAIFFLVPFEKFQIEFIDKRTITITKILKKGSKEPRLEILYPDQKSEPAVFPSRDLKNIHQYNLMFDEIIPDLEQVDFERLLDKRTKQLLSSRELYLDFNKEFPKRFGNVDQKLKEISGLVDTHFIRTERLQSKYIDQYSNKNQIYHNRNSASEQNILAVDEYSNEMSKRIIQTQAKYAELSTSLDRTFPMRLTNKIAEKNKSKTNNNQLIDDLNELEGKRNRLMSVGLLDKEESKFELPTSPEDDITRLVLEIYIKDVKSKLQVFEEDLQKAELFSQIINKKFINKTLKIEKNEGFLFFTPDNKRLPLSALSSGEQHEIVLLYEFLFCVKPESLILLDEPEISLHISWQQSFLSDLLAITKLIGFDVLIATHSPDIIHDRWDLTVDLEKRSKS